MNRDGVVNRKEVNLYDAPRKDRLVNGVLGAAAQSVVLTGAAGADVTGGRLVFDYTGGTTPAAAVKAALATAAGNGFTSGQIRSSTATAVRGLG